MSKNEVMQLIVKKLNKEGVSRAVNGYEFLKELIFIRISNQDKIYKLQELYGIIAEKFETKSNNVARCIEYAINHRKNENFYEYGVGIFVSMVCEEIILQIEG